jgi:hypothetical protein
MTHAVGPHGIAIKRGRVLREPRPRGGGLHERRYRLPLPARIARAAEERQLGGSDDRVPIVVPQQRHRTDVSERSAQLAVVPRLHPADACQGRARLHVQTGCHLLRRRSRNRCAGYGRLDEPRNRDVLGARVRAGVLPLPAGTVITSRCSGWFTTAVEAARTVHRGAPARLRLSRELPTLTRGSGHISRVDDGTRQVTRPSRS